MTTAIIAIVGTAAFLAAVLWKSFVAGKAAQSGANQKDRADAYEEGIERIGKANTARHDAERAARGGVLDDEWTRND